MTLQDNIDNLYKEIYNKGKLCKEASRVFGRSPGCVRNWFYTKVPRIYQRAVIKLLQKTIQHQNNVIDDFDQKISEIVTGKDEHV